jgi:tetratricopeptide (TPR) repeat protein
MKQLITIVLFCCFALQLTAQESTNNECSRVAEYISLHRFEDALSILNQHCESNTENIFRKGFCYFKLGNYKQANSAFLQVLKQDSLHTPTLLHLGLLNYQDQKYKAALKYFEALIDIEKGSSWYYKQSAISAFKAGEISKSVEYYNHTLKLNPADFEAAGNLIELYILMDGFFSDNLNTAEEVANKMLKIDPENTLMLSKKAKVAYKAKNYKTVYSTVHDLMQLGDSSSATLKMLGISCHSLKKNKEAILYLEEILKRKEESDVIHYYLGLAWREEGNHKKSVEHLEKSILLSFGENLPHYYTQLAVTYEEKKEYAKALKYYQAAYQETKDNVLLFHLARNYDLHYKDKKKALQYYEKYLASNDTINQNYQEYSRFRVKDLKGAKHFEVEPDKQN